MENIINNYDVKEGYKILKIACVEKIRDRMSRNESYNNARRPWERKKPKPYGSPNNLNQIDIRA